MPRHPRLNSVNGPWGSLLAIILVVAVLWAAKAVLIPLALGVILAFLLTPLVRLFDRSRFPRFVGVMLTMLIALGAVGGVGYVAFDQFAELSTHASKYTSSMRRKIADLPLGNDAALSKLTRTMDRVTEQLDNNAADLRRAQPVRVVPPRRTPIERFRDTAHTVFEPLASAIIVIVLVAFMLGQREDLRDRFIRLIGPESVTLTTRLMDEAAHRVSQFILAQTLMNIAFGMLVAAGLYWIGVPYAALWGGLTAVLRFVPYVGTLLSTLSPALLAFATFPGWAETLQTLALFISLDLLAAYFVEPVVFGQRTGVSSFALLVSALFWIWVWGPIGLLLATPLTVCFAVLGRHVRSLRFLAVMFADEPALTPHVRFYQRLLARDEDEASALVDHKLAELGPIGLIDHVLAPALALVIQHRAQDEITEEDAKFVLDVASEAVQQIAAATPPPAPGAPSIVGLAARTPVDQVVLEMLRAALGETPIELVPAELSEEQAVQRAIERKPTLICIAGISPTRGSEVRNHCRRIRSALPDTKVLVLRPTLAEADPSRSAARMKEAGADYVATGTKDAVEAIANLLAGKSEQPIEEPPMVVA
ncbi:MAG: AI-2E family transporter [Steroidobacter sp.]